MDISQKITDMEFLTHVVHHLIEKTNLNDAINKQVYYECRNFGLKIETDCDNNDYNIDSMKHFIF